MLRPGTQDTFISSRVMMPTAKSHAELVRDVEPKIRAQAFFSARVAEAHILEKLRAVSDGYSRGELSLGEARNMLKDFLRAEGYDPHQAGLRNLASTARLNLILKQNAAMAHAAAEWKRMHDPAAMKVFPYVRYHARQDRRTRDSHSRLDGKIFRKDDPFLLTHTPPWEFNCRCWLEEITTKAAEREAENIQPPTPPEEVKIDSDSGFSFDPEHAFEVQDLGNLQPMSRTAIVKQAENAVKNQTLGSVGMITAPATSGLPPAPLPNLDKVKQGFEAMREEARNELGAVGLDPDHLPDFEATNEAFREAKKQGKNIPGSVRDRFPAEPIEVATLNRRACEASGLPPDVPVLLGRGGPYTGIEHLWRDHKELFVDPELAIRLLRETLGDPNCRVVVSLKRAVARARAKKTTICLKRIVLHNPAAKTYCVMIYDGRELKLVSWNNAGEDYGLDEWTLE